MKTVYTDRALADIDVAMEWYEEQRKGLSLEFLDCLETIVNKIGKNPDAYRIQYQDVHSAAIARFPFTVFYTIEGDEVVIHAVFHNRLDPEKRP